MALRSHLKGINYFVEQGVASLVKKTQTYVLVLRWKIAVHHRMSLLPSLEHRGLWNIDVIG